MHTDCEWSGIHMKMHVEMDFNLNGGLANCTFQQHDERITMRHIAEELKCKSFRHKQGEGREKEQKSRWHHEEKINSGKSAKVVSAILFLSQIE